MGHRAHRQRRLSSDTSRVQRLLTANLARRILALVRTLGALGVVIALVVSVASSNASSLATTRLGFVRGPSIFLAAAGGTKPQILLRGKTDTKYYFDPVWSRSGRLAFTTETYPTGSHGYDDVFVSRRPGHAKPLYVPGGGSAINGAPSWAPDNQRLALIGFNYGAGGSLYVARPGARDSHPVSKDASVDDVANEPAWSPDGKLIAFVQDEGSGFRLFVIHPDGSGRTQLTQTLAHNPSWSPDNTRIIFDDGRDILVVSSSGAELRHLTSTVVRETDPAWSPDGQAIAFVRQGSIWLMDRSGAHVRRFIRSGAQPAWKPR